MSAAAGDFAKRLAALVEEARSEGQLAGLADELSQVASEARAARESGSGAADQEEVPQRFGMVGASEPMQKVFELIAKVAPSDVAVLVLGETGTGKELVARALHHYGTRADKPFLAENCAAVPAELLESELFGHKRGSFTGAVADRPGHFVAADGGTVFLDEIGDMPLPMQAKLLRVLQEGEVRPVGSNKTIRVDVRIVAATNKDLRAMCDEKTFRQDLYFRLNVISIALPPLRERAGDVQHLVRFIMKRVGEEMGLEPSITPEAVEALTRWRWPGNVRELENELRRSIALSGGSVTLDVLSEHVREA